MRQIVVQRTYSIGRIHGAWNQPNELTNDYEEGEVELDCVDGLATRTKAPPDSSRWTTGVVP